MKKILIVLVIVIGFGFITNAQDEVASVLYENGQVDVFKISQPQTYNYPQCEMKYAKSMRDAGIALFSTGMAFTFPIGVTLFSTGVFNNWNQFYAGVAFIGIGSALTVSGIVTWAVGQTRMDRIKRLNPNGLSLFENEKVQLNLAIGGNSMGLKLNF